MPLPPDFVLCIAPSKLNNAFRLLFSNSFFLGQALGLLVSISYMCYHTSTFDLSTRSPPGVLTAFAWEILSRRGLHAQMLSAFIPSALGYPAMPLAEQQVHQRCVHPGPLVLRTALLKFPAPVIDRDRTVSRRSEPSSRTTLMGEQPNPWNRLQLQDAMSRHRGAKPPRRCGRLGEISLLSPG